MTAKIRTKKSVATFYKITIFNTLAELKEIKEAVEGFQAIQGYSGYIAISQIDASRSQNNSFELSISNADYLHLSGQAISMHDLAVHLTSKFHLKVVTLTEQPIQMEMIGEI
jgi:hypothetical protein